MLRFGQAEWERLIRSIVDFGKDSQIGKMDSKFPMAVKPLLQSSARAVRLVCLIHAAKVNRVRVQGRGR